MTTTTEGTRRDRVIRRARRGPRSPPSAVVLGTQITVGGAQVWVRICRPAVGGGTHPRGGCACQGSAPTSSALSAPSATPIDDRAERPPRVARPVASCAIQHLRRLVPRKPATPRRLHRHRPGGPGHRSLWASIAGGRACAGLPVLVVPSTAVEISRRPGATAASSARAVSGPAPGCGDPRQQLWTAASSIDVARRDRVGRLSVALLHRRVTGDRCSSRAPVVDVTWLA